MIAEACRCYLGTPFRHRGRSARYLDCAGLLVVAAADLGRALIDIHAYGREPWRDGLRAAVHANFGPPVEREPQPDDILLMNYRSSEPRHLAVCYAHPHGLGIVHAYAEVGRVVEHRLDEVWRSRIVEVYQWPA